MRADRLLRGGHAGGGGGAERRPRRDGARVRALGVRVDDVRE
jgi:hypothetical protein